MYLIIIFFILTGVHYITGSIMSGTLNIKKWDENTRLFIPIFWLMCNLTSGVVVGFITFLNKI